MGIEFNLQLIVIHLMERLLSAEMGLIVIVEIDEELVLTMVVLQDGYNNYRK